MNILYNLNNPALVTMARPNGFQYNGYKIKYDWCRDAHVCELSVKGYHSHIIPKSNPVIVEYLRQLKIYNDEQEKKYRARMDKLAENKKNSPWTAFQWRLKIFKELGYYSKRQRAGSAFLFYEVFHVEPGAVDEKRQCFHEDKIQHGRTNIARFEAKRTYSPESFAACVEKIKADILGESKKEHDEVLKAIDAL